MLLTLPDDLLHSIFENIEIYQAPNRRIRQVLLKRQKSAWQLRLSCVTPRVFTGKVHTDRLWFTRDRETHVSLSRGWQHSDAIQCGVPYWMPPHLNLQRSPTCEELTACVNVSLQVRPSAHLLDLSTLSLIHMIGPPTLTLRSIMKVACDENGEEPLPQFGGLEFGPNDYITLEFDISCVPNKVLRLHTFHLITDVYVQVQFVPLCFMNYDQCKAWNIC